MDIESIGADPRPKREKNLKKEIFVTIDDLKLIVELTLLNTSRPKIAKRIKKSSFCVYKWQRKFFE
jgi:hypothetical protein